MNKSINGIKRFVFAFGCEVLFFLILLFKLAPGAEVAIITSMGAIPPLYLVSQSYTDNTKIKKGETK